MRATVFSLFLFMASVAFGAGDLLVTGNIGAGTTTPKAKLELVDSSNTRIIVGVPSGTNGLYSDLLLRGTFFNYPSDVYRRNVGLIRSGFSTGTWNTGYLSFGVAGSDCYTDGDTSPCTRMIITNNGKVGIGTTNPQTKLDVNGGIKTLYGTHYSMNYVVGSSSGWFKLGTLTLPQGGYNASITIHGGQGYNANNNQNAYVTIYIRTSNGVSVDGSGFAFSAFASRFGRNSNFASSIKIVPNADGTAATNYDIYVYTGAHVGQGWYTIDAGGGGWSHAATAISEDPGGYSVPFEHMVLNDFSVTGNVSIGTTDPGTYKLYVNGPFYATSGPWGPSDIKFKKNLQPINNSLSKIVGIDGVSYEWKTDEYKDKNFPEGRHYGVIAQEIEKVLPEVVKEGPDGTKVVTYTEIIPVLIEAIKEQQKEIEQLKRELVELQR